MKASQLIVRINSVSTPLGGVAWVPPVLDAQVAKNVVRFLEDRRVLFSGATEEVPDHCIRSVLEIRKFLTEVLLAGGIAEPLEHSLRLMRGYCRNFMDRTGQSESWIPGDEGDRYLGRDHRFAMHDYKFGEALGELRSGIALQVGFIAGKFRLDLEDQLANLIPQDESSED